MTSHINKWDATHGATVYKLVCDSWKPVCNQSPADWHVESLRQSLQLFCIEICFDMSMQDQQLNFLLVAEVEKRPILYNFQLPGYSKKHETEKAWVEICKIVKLPAAECKERWKNIRAVFVRHMKPPKSGAGTKDKKAYYLSDALQFAVPYIKALGNPSGNLPPPPQVQEEEELVEDGEVIVEYLESEVPSPSFLIAQPSLSALPPSVSSSGYSTPTAGLSMHREHQSESITPRIGKRKRDVNNNAVDKAFMQYLENKTATTSNKDQNVAKDPKTEALKMFLLSMLPDLQKMNDQEVRQFKRRALDAVDDILSARCTRPPSLSPSTTHYSPSGLQQAFEEVPPTTADGHRCFETADANF